MSQLVQERYEPALSPVRVRFALSPALYAFLDPKIDVRVMELFLIQFCARGVGMTEPVEGWIERAGRRCEDLGLGDLGQALRAHARQEADHHLLMIEDTRTLVARWNDCRKPSLDADQLLTQPPTLGVLKYRRLHEDTIAGDTPYAQIAIEYEIEMLSVRFGPGLLERRTRDLGPGIMSGLRFLQEHVALDVGHTKFNEQQLERVLRNNPDYLPALVRAGSTALDTYAEFLADCLQAARLRKDEG